MTTPDPQQQADQRDFNRRLILTLEQGGIDYAVAPRSLAARFRGWATFGGSVAAMAYSEPRTTIDIDVMIAMDHDRLELLVDEIGCWNVYVDSVETIDEFLRPNRMPINVVDGISGVKADLYVARPDGLDVLAMTRRRRLPLYEQPSVEAWFLSPEDVILYKLDYYRQSQGVSTKHPKDIAKMLRVVGDQLDLDYLAAWTHKLGVAPIWQAIWDEHRKQAF